MAYFHSPRTVTDGLVFYYDTGNVLKSYKGEPATNIWTSGHPNGQGSELETIYTDFLLGKRIDSGVVYRNRVSNPAQSNTSTYYNNGGLNKGGMGFQSLNASTRYIQISFNYYGVTPYVRHSNPGNGLNGYLSITYTDSTTDAYGWDTTYSPGSGDDWNNDAARMGYWQKISLIVALNSAKTPSNISAFYLYYDALMYGEGYFANMIFTEHATYPTGPVPFTNGTRSSTQGLLDLTGNSTIDIANVSFDSDGQITFDGTSDYISLGDNSLFDFINGIGSVEAIVKFPSSWTAGSQYPNLISKGASAGWDTDGWSLFGFRSYGSGTGYTLGIGIRNTGTVKTTLAYDQPADTWLHVVGTLDGSSIKIYINGALVTTNSQTVNPGDNNTNVYIGRDPSSQYFPGDIPYVKIYNRALTASEIANNYNAVKSRFGI